MVSTGPGPIYALPPLTGYDKHDQRKTRFPQYSLGARLKTLIGSISPGPINNIQEFTRYGRATSHTFSLAARNFSKDQNNIGPGPANYDVSKSLFISKDAAPAYSIGRPNVYRFKSLIPGPNAYSVKDSAVKKSSPKFVLGMRTDVRHHFGSPGPANYPASNLRITMPKAAEYSLIGLSKEAKKIFVPGSNAYDCMSYKPGKSQPSYSFGLRHSIKSPPMVLPCDKVKILGF